MTRPPFAEVVLPARHSRCAIGSRPRAASRPGSSSVHRIRCRRWGSSPAASSSGGARWSRTGRMQAGRRLCRGRISSGRRLSRGRISPAREEGRSSTTEERFRQEPRGRAWWTSRSASRTRCPPMRSSRRRSSFRTSRTRWPSQRALASRAIPCRSRSTTSRCWSTSIRTSTPRCTSRWRRLCRPALARLVLRQGVCLDLRHIRISARSSRRARTTRGEGRR